MGIGWSLVALLDKNARSFYSALMPAPRPQRSPRVAGIDHVTVTTRDDRAAAKFYALALGPLGFSVTFDWPEGGRTYLGLPSEPSSIWLERGTRAGGASLSVAAPHRAAVDEFYAAARAAGGRPASPPADRPEHTLSTYAAAVLDPDGNSIEAICWVAGPDERVERAA